MIRHLRGTISIAEPTYVVLDVHGVGYQVYTSEGLGTFVVGSDVLLHTYHVVRENVNDLYGFSNPELLAIFELLLELPKIGPKSAAHILSQADITLLKEAVAQNDPSYLSKMSGIGKKSAEKIVAGLKEQFEKSGMAVILDQTTTSATDRHTVDTIDALVSLGYPQADARRALQYIHEEYPTVTDSGEAVKLALKYLST